MELVTQSSRAMALVPTCVSDAVKLAEVLSSASLIPEHLRNKPGDCLLVVMQAQRWGMDALSVAACTSVVRGKLCYEGKLVAAVLYSMGAVDGRLRYDFTGEGSSRSVRVTGRPRGEDEQSVSGSVAAWATNNEAWKRDPDSMLVYRGTRQWARLYAPEALLGVYTPDEMEEAPRSVVVTQQAAGLPPPQATEIDESPEDAAQINEIAQLISESNADIDAFLRHFKIGSLADLPPAKYAMARSMLRRKIQEAANAQ